MGPVNSAVGAFFDVLFLPFGLLGPWPAMILVSFLTGLLMLAVFRWTSNQEAIRRTKARIRAHLFEIRLYKDNFGQSMKAQGRVLAANGRYLSYAFVPMLVMIIPIMMVLFQLDLRFGRRPLEPGESALLKVRFENKVSPSGMEVELKTPPGVVLETPSFLDAKAREVDWRLAAETAGRFLLLIRTGQEEFSTPLVVGAGRLAKVPAVKPGRGIVGQFSHPGEPPVPRGTGIASVEVVYPIQRMRLFGLNLHWLVAFFVLSIVFGLVFKRVMKVEI